MPSRPLPGPVTALPGYLQIEPVGQCNLRCRMCPVQYRPESAPRSPPALLDFDLYCRLLDGFDGVSELHLQGLGEPLLHPRFFDMVRVAVARGLRVSTNTNMTLMTEARAAECVDSGLHRLHVSIDGASRQVYETIRVNARLPKVLRNLRWLMRAKSAAAAWHPEVQMVVVAMRENLAELPALVRLAAEEGIVQVSVQQLCHDFGEHSLPAQYRPMRRFIDGQMLAHADPRQVSEIFAEARAEAARLGIGLRLPQLRLRRHAPGTPGRERCDWPWRGAYLSYDGKAMPCCMVATPDRIHFGDMAVDGVAAVWNGPAYEDFRRRLSSDDPPAVCRSCAVYNGTF